MIRRPPISTLVPDTTLFRSISRRRRVATVRIGVVPLEMDSEGRIVNSSGVMNLIQAIKNSTHYGAEFKGSVNLGHEITECDLIFLTGQQEFTLADEWMLRSEEHTSEL